MSATIKWQPEVGSRVFHRGHDLFGKIVSIHTNDLAKPPYQFANVKYEWPYDPKAEPEPVPLEELDAASNWE